MTESKKKVFSKWLEGMLARIKEVAPKPDEEPAEMKMLGFKGKKEFIRIISARQ